MKRLLLAACAALALSLALGFIGYLTFEREAWLAGALCGVLTVVLAVLLLIFAIIERRVGHATAALAVGVLGFFAAYYEILIGAVVMADASGRPVRGLRRGRRAADDEHASVPAFARLAYQLWAHGAPPELIARAHRAALDEIDHARRLGVVVTPLPLGALEPGTLKSLVRESLVDGVIGEGRAAADAARQAAAAADPAEAELYAVIARDEAAHAQLARDVIAWAALTRASSRAAR